MSKLVCEVGVNDLPRGSCSDDKGNSLPFYKTWTSMLYRCFSEKKQEERPTYKDCTVCNEWLLLSNFKKWYDSQYKEEGWHLDKDILVPNNKVYSPTTCRFVPSNINNLLIGRGRSRGKHLIGVSWHKDRRKYQLSYGKSNVLQKRKELKLKGRYTSEIEAHNAYRYIKSLVIVDTITQLKLDHPKLDSDILAALQLRADKLLDYSIPYEDFM